VPEIGRRRELLVVVEVEFASVDEALAFSPPDWFGPDVTGDSRYRNAALAVTQAVPIAPSP
jgi:CYTH domain-containing protein